LEFSEEIIWKMVYPIHISEENSRESDFTLEKMYEKWTADWANFRHLYYCVLRAV
jgi:hypothetical protein